jgi:hypothetical protein
MASHDTTEAVERVMREANRRLSNLEHAVLEAGEADAFLNWLRTALTTIRKDTKTQKFTGLDDRGYETGDVSKVAEYFPVEDTKISNE